MARFAFEAQDRKGRVVRGTREAESAGDLASALRERELSVTQIRPAPGPTAQVLTDTPATQSATPNVPPGASWAAPVALGPVGAAAGGAPGAGPGAGGAGGVAYASPSGLGGVGVASGSAGGAVARRDWTSRATAMQLSLYFRQAHALLHAGSSISHALAVAARHDAAPALRRVSEEMSRATAAGTPWSETMRSYPGLFTDLAVGMVAAGESSGRVDDACQRLAAYAERDYHLQQTIKRETWYPKLLFACSIFIPSVVPLVLSGPGAWWLSVRPSLLAVGVAVIAWRALKWASPLIGQAQTVARTIDTVKMSTPVLGKVTRGLASAKFCRALGATMGAGVPLNRAMSLAAGACDNTVLADAAERARQQVLTGDTLTGALSATKQFPPVAMQMLATGEASGQTEEQLDKVADFLEGDAETAVKQAVKLLGVLVLLLVAWRIGTMVIGFYAGSYMSGMDSLMSDS